MSIIDKSFNQYNLTITNSNSNSIKPKSNSIKSNSKSNKLKSNSKSIKPKSNSIKPKSNTNKLKSNSIKPKTNSNKLNSNSNKLKSNSNKLKSNSIKPKSNSNKSTSHKHYSKPGSLSESFGDPDLNWWKTSIRSKTKTQKIKTLTQQNQGKTIARFMKNVNPNKRRAYFLKSVCSDSGVCIAFGKENDKIKQHFDNFANFNYVTKKERIGAHSVNGFVDLITYENEGYISNAILKSSRIKNGDNLYYEFLVGQFINNQSLRFSCFVETYDLYNYINDDNLKNNIKNSPSFILQNGINKLDKKSGFLKMSCKNSQYMAILIQSIKDATPIHEMILFYKFANNDLLYALFQVYFPFFYYYTF